MRRLLVQHEFCWHYGKMHSLAGTANFPANIMNSIGLNKKEIAIIAQTNRDNYAVEIKVDAQGLWQAAIKIIQPEQHFAVFTSRGVLKTWGSLDLAIAFVQDTCANCQKVTITTGNWTFSRIT